MAIDLDKIINSEQQQYPKYIEFLPEKNTKVNVKVLIRLMKQ